MTNSAIRTLSALAALSFAACSLIAQPKVTGVTNAADYTSTVAPGSLATVFGTGLAASEANATALPLSTTLNGVSVNVNGKPVPMVYVSAAQVNFQVPAGTAAGSVSVSVTTGGQTSNVMQFQVGAAAPGIFQYGTNRGVIQNQDYSLNSSSNPAASGSSIIVYLTGIGVTKPAVADGAGSPASPLAFANGAGTATIGGANAPVQFLGLTPGNVGLAQANIQVPALSTGDYPLTITVGGQSSKSVLVSVKGTGTGSGPIGGLPQGATCVSGQVDYILFSLEAAASRLADEVSIGGTKLCAKCQLKPPVYGNFADKLQEAREAGISVDACYDSLGTMNYVRMRP